MGITKRPFIASEKRHSKAERVQETERFLASIFHGCNSGFFQLWGLPSKRSYWFEPGQGVETAARRAHSMNTRQSVYFSSGLRAADLGQNARGASSDIIGITALWCALDVQGPAHKETSLPATKLEAFDFLRFFEVASAIPLPPSFLVDSGHGAQAWWLL